MRKYLASLRKSCGLTQKQAADKLLISQNYLSLIEKGSRQTDLKLSTLKGFAEIYRVPLLSLINQEAQYKDSEPV